MKKKPNTGILKKKPNTGFYFVLAIYDLAGKEVDLGGAKGEDCYGGHLVFSIFVIFSHFRFLAVQNSSIGDLVTHSLTH